MKIENYTLSMRSEYASTYSKSTLFETELKSLAAEKEVERRKALDGELQLVARLRYELLNRLMRMFGGGYRQAEPESMIVERPRQLVESARVRVIERQYEQHSFEVSMAGCIQTDTQSIAIDVNLAMSHTFVTEREISETVFYDPLVINFDGEIPQLSDTTFSFDIDNDGTEDQISRLKAGNGFLALDKNGNGCIDAGCELFGTEQGNGFVELSMHDSDGNDWIDENDPVFDKLRIWTEEEGEKRLIGLGEAGVGAIYLGSAYTPMDYRNAENEALGRLHATGLFLHENGRSGVIGELDFASQKASDSAEGLSQALASI